MAINDPKNTGFGNYKTGLRIQKVTASIYWMFKSVIDDLKVEMRQILDDLTWWRAVTARSAGTALAPRGTSGAAA